MKKLVVLLLALVFMVSCSETPERLEKELADEPAIPITYANIADHLMEKVVIEGQITNAFFACDLDPYNYCFKIEPPDYDYSYRSIIVKVRETEEPGTPNSILVTEYDNGNTGFKFFTVDGQTLTRYDNFRITGILSLVEGDSRSKGTYYLRASLIEAVP